MMKSKKKIQQPLSLYDINDKKESLRLEKLPKEKDFPIRLSLIDCYDDYIDLNKEDIGQIIVYLTERYMEL